MTQSNGMYQTTPIQYGAETPQHYYQTYLAYPEQQQYVQQQYLQQYPQQQYVQQQYSEYDYAIMQRWFDYKNDKWVKGAIVGAAAALIITNKTVQKTLAKGVLGIWGTLQSGVEEFKEQIRDIQAENNEESI